MSRPPSQLILMHLDEIAHSLVALKQVAESYRNLSGTQVSEHLLGAMREIESSMSGQVETLGTLLRKHQIELTGSNSLVAQLRVQSSKA